MIELTTIAITKIAGSLLAKLVLKQIITFNQDQRTGYIKELTEVIEKTVEEYKSKYDHQDKLGKISFIKSHTLLENLLEISLSKEFNKEDITLKLHTDERILTPEPEQLEYFFARLENNLRSSENLSKLHVNDNFKQEIFSISSGIKELQNKTNKIEEATVRIENNLNVLTGDLKSNLNEEFHQQLDNIKRCIERFQVKTGLELIESLKKRISRRDIEDKIINSKIIYFEALCRRELSEKKTESFKLFIKAYRLYPSELSFLKSACVAFVNLKESGKAKELAQEIIDIDEYDVLGWAVKTVTSEDIKLFIKNEVPALIKVSPGFNNSISHFLIINGLVSKPTDLENFGVHINVDNTSFRDLTIFTKEEWTLNIQLLYNLELQNRRENYVLGDEFYISINSELRLLIEFLEKYINTIGKTEITEDLDAYKFLLHYYKYSLTNDVASAKELDVIFPEIEKDNLKLIQYCQVLNHQKRYRESLIVLQQFKKPDDPNFTQILIYQFLLNIHLKSLNKGFKVLEKYVNSIEIVSFSDYRNLKMVLDLCVKSSLGSAEMGKLVELILKKSFSDDSLKLAAQVELNLLFKEISPEEEKEFVKTLSTLSYNAHPEILLSLFNSLRILKENNKIIEIGEKYLTEKMFSDETKIYLFALYEDINSGQTEIEKRYQKLLKGLENWRKNCPNPDIDLLKLEHNLFVKLNDWKKTLEVTKKLYDVKPQEEMFIAVHFEALAQTSSFEVLKNLSDQIQDFFNSENFGLHVARSLLIQKTNVPKAFEIVYNLAKDKRNTNARMFYFAQSTTIREDKFQTFPDVRVNSFIEYEIEGQKYDEHVTADHSWIGKKVESTFTITKPISGGITTVKLTICYNKYVHLFREIIKEANNPINKLGIQAYSLDGSSKEGLEGQLKRMLGIQGEREDNHQKEVLSKYSKYELGFIPLVNDLFQEDFWTGYNYLTKFFAFHTVPMFFYKKEFRKTDRFVLDFSSLFMFYNIESELGVALEMKFTVSNIIPLAIDNLIRIEESSPTASMRLKITTKNVQPTFIPENYGEIKIAELKKIRSWVEERCETTIVPEKLDFIFKLENEPKGLSGQLIIDNVLLSLREDHCLLTNDVFYIRNIKDHRVKIKSAEEFLYKFCSSEDLDNVHKLLLSKKYIGISFSKKTLLSSFHDHLARKNDSYLIALQSLSEDINPTTSKTVLITSFLADIYLVNSISMEEKNRHSYSLFMSVFRGSNSEFRRGLYLLLGEKFKLLGEAMEEVLRTFLLAEKQLYGGI